MHPEFVFQIASNWPYIRKMTIMSQLADLILLSIFFWRCLVSLVRFGYWSYSVVLVIFGYKGLSRNPETRNIPVWFLSNIWRLEKIKDAKFGTNISNKMLMNAVKCQFLPYFSYQEKTSRGVLAHRKSWGRCTKMIMIITSWYDTS